MKKLFLFILTFLITNLAMSQTTSSELVSSSGDRFKNTRYQLEWSVGECVTATCVRESYVISQGLHHSGYDIVTGVDNIAKDVNITVYPNPTVGLINLELNSLFENGMGNLLYSVIDFSGKVLQSERITGKVEHLDFSNYTAGVYCLIVRQENSLIGSFKIIKK